MRKPGAGLCVAVMIACSPYLAPDVMAQSKTTEPSEGNGGTLERQKTPGKFTVAKAQAYLEGQGFEQINISRKDGKLQANACADDRIHTITIKSDGSIRSARTEKRCRNTKRSRQLRFGPGKIKQTLEREGYDRITVINDRQTPYEVLACRDKDRVRVAIDRQGRITGTERIDRCQPKAKRPKLDLARFRADGVPKRLQEQGFRNIQLIAGAAFPYRVRGCKGNDLLELNIGSGGVIERSRIGDCVGPVKRDRNGEIADFDPSRIVEIYNRDGYDRINVLRIKRAPYQIRACLNGDRLDLRIGKRGNITKKTRIGRCPAPLKPAAIEALLRKQGYSRFEVLQRNVAPYSANACRGTDFLRLRIGRFRKITVERELGRCGGTLSQSGLRDLLSKRSLLSSAQAWSAEKCETGCNSRTFEQVLRRLETRGAERVEAMVEGCYQGNKYRWEFDRRGNRKRRVRIGECR